MSLIVTPRRSLYSKGSQETSTSFEEAEDDYGHYRDL